MLGPNNYGGDVVIRTKHAYVVKILEYIGLYVYRRFSVLWSSVIAIHSRGGGSHNGKGSPNFLPRRESVPVSRQLLRDRPV